MSTYTENIRRILSFTRRAVDDYAMIEEGDRIAVGVSGGKDSLTLLCALAEMRRFYPKKYELLAIYLETGFDKAGFASREDVLAQRAKIRGICDSLSVPLYVGETHITEVVFGIRKEKNPCSLCARMRRGALHSAAKEHGCNKLALGHHFDDAVETFMMNLFNEGRLGCFSPVTYLDRRDITVIRPLIYANEKAIKYYAKKALLPVTDSFCPADKDSERARMKEMLTEYSKQYKGLKYRIFGAMQRGNIDGFREVESLPFSSDDPE